MFKLNENYKLIKETYLFSTVNKKAREYAAAHPDKTIIKMGIGDVTLPLADGVVDAMVKAAEEQRQKETFRGYGPETGYDFLVDKIASYYQNDIKADVKKEDIFIGDGAKSDVANITDLFDDGNIITIPDPVYPVYLDSNLMRGRKINFLQGTVENGFLPLPDENTVGDIFYLCSPNNPTGAVYTKEDLKKWVDFALEKKALILFDSAYEGFVKDEKLPRSIYQIEGARKCCVEFNSFSKLAGFTGTRCGYTVVPTEIEANGLNLNKMWSRRQSTKFNGTAYVVQRAAQAVFEPETFAKIKENIAYYAENARLMAELLKEKGIYFTGGENSPYVWLKCPNGMSSWEFFDYLLENAQVVGTPGEGFGENGKGFFRLTAFNTRENTLEAIRRLSLIL